MLPRRPNLHRDEGSDVPVSPDTLFPTHRPLENGALRQQRPTDSARCRVWLWAFLFCLSLAAPLPAFAQGPELLREAFSREYSIHVGGEQTPLVKDIASREVSIFVGAEPSSPYAQAISREMSIVVTTLAIPARVTQLAVSVSPTGDRATLEWCSYNEIAQPASATDCLQSSSPNSSKTLRNSTRSSAFICKSHAVVRPMAVRPTTRGPSRTKCSAQESRRG